MDKVLFRIEDTFQSPMGAVICGVEPALDRILDPEIEALLKGGIEIELPDGRSAQTVLDVKSSTSPISQKNVFLVLYESAWGASGCNSA
jgi:hypothetical protein